MRTWLTVCSVLVLGLGFLWAGGQPAAPVKAEEAGIRAAFDLYAAAMKTGELKAILSNWTPDADFTDEAGVVHKGHEAIGKLFEENLKDLKAGKSAIKVESLRFLTPDVATMIGNVEFTPAKGDFETNRFSSVWIKQGGRWLIASARDLPETEDNMSERGLRELKWLTGDWTAEEKDTTVKLNVKPALDGKFAAMTYDIKSPKGALTVIQLLGYDPIQGGLRAWTFDSRGGFGESVWARENGTWISQTTGVLPTGQTGTSVNTIRVTGPDSFTWQSTQREVEGQPIPDHTLKYTRVVPKN